MGLYRGLSSVIKKIRHNLPVKLHFSKECSSERHAILNYETVRTSWGGVLYLYLFGMRWKLGIKGERKGAGQKTKYSS